MMKKKTQRKKILKKKKTLPNPKRDAIINL
jgi:hypothetical protein